MDAKHFEVFKASVRELVAVERGELTPCRLTRFERLPDGRVRRTVEERSGRVRVEILDDPLGGSGAG